MKCALLKSMSKSNRCKKAETVKEWRVCDNLTNEIRNLYKEKRNLEVELKVLQRKNLSGIIQSVKVTASLLHLLPPKLPRNQQ